MLAEIRSAAVALALLTAITGVAYPLAVTGLAKGIFRDKADGSLIMKDGHVIGSTLLGQPFDDPKYFWGRLSGTSPMPYNAGASTGTNLGPTNTALRDAAKARIDALRAADPDNHAPVPIDLVTASGSGLDPHVSVAAARFQAPRVARVRKLDPARVNALVDESTDAPTLGFLGEPRVNVLALNLALDDLH